MPNVFNARKAVKELIWTRVSRLGILLDVRATLGSLYSVGLGVPKDHAQAARWLRRAANRGNAGAQLSLGLKNGVGEGVSQDYVLAYMWFNLAAANGNDLAAKVRDGTSLTLPRQPID
jgi:TPR repeat protein